MKDDIVFALYKDKAIGRKEQFRDTIKEYVDEVDFETLYLRIVNYQVEKYNTQLLKKQHNRVFKVFMEGQIVMEIVMKEYNLESFKEKDIYTWEEIISVIETLEAQIYEANETITKLTKDMEDNYKRIEVKDQIDVYDNSFIQKGVKNG